MEYHGSITENKLQLCSIISLHLLLPESTFLVLDLLEIFLRFPLHCLLIFFVGRRIDCCIVRDVVQDEPKQTEVPTKAVEPPVDRKKHLLCGCEEAFTSLRSGKVKTWPRLGTRPANPWARRLTCSVHSCSINN